MPRSKPDYRAIPIDGSMKKMRFSDMIVMNLLIAIPYIISFLSIAAIYSLGAVPDVATAFQNRVYTILLTLPALLPWFFSIKILRSYLWNYQVSLPFMLFIYSLFILPILRVSISLRNDGTPDYIILIATFALSQIYLWLTFFAFKDGNILSLRTAPLLVLIFAVICLAIFGI